MGLSAAAFQIDPEVLTEVETPPTGLWVPAPLSGEIVHLDAEANAVTARVAVSDRLADLVVEEGDGGVVVVDRTAGQISLVDPALHQVVRTTGSLPASESMVDIGPDGIVAVAGAEAVLVDPSVTDSTQATVPADSRSVVADGDGALVENGADRIAIDADGATERRSGSDGPLVRVGDRIVEARQDGVRTLGGERLACFEDFMANPDHIIGSSIGWVVAIVGSTVHVADLTNGECAATALIGEVGELARPVVAARRVFVAERFTGEVHVVDPSRESDQVHLVLEPGDLRLRARDDFVVAYDPGSSLAVFLGADGPGDAVSTSVGGSVSTTGEGEGVVAVVEEDSTDDGLVEETDESASGATANIPVIDANVVTTQVESEQIDEPLPSDELVANFALSATTVAVDVPVRFVDKSSGSPDSWVWDFGDGTGDEGPEAEKSWEEPGSYTVTLRVGRGEEADEISLPITVVPADATLRPAADFVYSSTVVGVGKPVEFEDRSDGDIERWRWDFGDGDTASAPDVTKSWSRAGTYTVRLTVANEQGSDTASVVVTVVDGLRAPVAAIDVATTTVDLGEAVAFVGSSSTDQASYRWDFGDGKTSRGEEVTHVFLAEGTFRVTLRAENSVGVSTATVDIVVAPATRPPRAVIGTLPVVIEVGDVVTLSSLSTNSPDSELWAFGDGQSATGARVTHTWGMPGTYLVTLTATNGAGSDTVTQSVQVLAELPAPVAQIGDFVASPWVGQTTLFVDASVDATSWEWDFGDGVTSNAPDPLHTFTSPGQKVVTLTVSNRNGTDSTSVIVEPRLEPTAAFSTSATAIRAGGSVAFTDGSVNAVSWEWDFGDGGSSTERNPTRRYSAAGTFDVVLTVRSSTGDTATSDPVTITVDPAAPRLDGITKFPNDTGPVTTSTTSSYAARVAAASGPIDLYEISYGDGSPLERNATGTFSHVYTSSGTYTMTMRARGALGDFSPTVSRTVTVVDPAAPLVSISGVPSSAQVGTVTLTGNTLAGSGPVAVWRWEITQGANQVTYTGRVVDHTFTAPGNYRVRLIAESPVPAVSNGTDTHDITITPPPAPVIQSLVASPATTTTGQRVIFTPQVTGSVSTWEWDYVGAGYVPGAATGEYIFNTVGTKTVWLRATGPFGQEATRSVTVVVLPPPDPSPPAASPAGPVPVNTTVSFTSTEANGLTGLTWSWRITKTGVSAPTAVYTDVGPTQAHQFTEAGTWTIEVTATDARGVSGSDVLSLTVNPVITPNFTATPTAVPNQMAFVDSSTGSPIDAWLWDFGDGQTSTAQNPTVTFAAPGPYSVTLSVTSGGVTRNVTKTVNVP
ncbi:MAG: PKD domain-containing protein [Acidimicrobiales bacterium]